ncbi:MAG TPA: hypothetical protein VKV15_10785 [Bryobacteraceae bacterium]|nr:hypothetical protein [Bryobacteraceae bacterium]
MISLGDAPRTILTNDPVIHTTYTLDPNSHKSHKVATAISPEQAEAFAKKLPAESKWFSTQPALEAQAGPQPTLSVGTGPTLETPKLAGHSSTANLDSQTINGVLAQDTRTTRTIPAAAIGSEREIQIVMETWYSPELRTVVMRKTTNPMEGDTSFELTNIQRGDPPQSMFEAPPDYTTVEDTGPEIFEYRVRKQKAEAGACASVSPNQ